MLWATNWPHPTEPRDAMPDDAMLLDVLLDWVPDAATRQRILVDNPAALYGY
jgi:D-galactarolactone isomerase